MSFNDGDGEDEYDLVNGRVIVSMKCKNYVFLSRDEKKMIK